MDYFNSDYIGGLICAALVIISGIVVDSIRRRHNENKEEMRQAAEKLLTKSLCRNEQMKFEPFIADFNERIQQHQKATYDKSELLPMVTPHPKFVLFKKSIPIANLYTNIWYALWNVKPLTLLTEQEIDDAQKLTSESKRYQYFSDIVSGERNSFGEWCVDTVEPILLHLDTVCKTNYRGLDITPYFEELWSAVVAAKERQHPTRLIIRGQEQFSSFNYIRGIVIELKYHNLIFIVD